METRIPTRSRLLPIAAVVLLFALIVIFGWRSFGGASPLEAHGYRVDVPLVDALNMAPGADVTISGVHVGDVVMLHDGASRPVATIELEHRYAPLRRDARAIPRSKSLLGEAYIEIAPGSRTAPQIPDGGALTGGNVQRAQTLDQVLETLSPTARRNFRALFAGLNGAFRRRGQDMNDAIGNAAPLAAGLGDVLRKIDGQRPELRRLVANSAEVFAALGAREGALQQAVIAGDAVLDTTARRDRALAATVRALPPFLRNLGAASRELQPASGDLDAAVAALRPAAARVDPVLQDLGQTAPPFERAFTELTPVLLAGDRGLPALTSIVAAAGPSLADIYPASRELIPTLDLLSDVRSSLVGFFGNLGSLANGTIDVPGRRELAHPVSAMPSFWNESVGGWKMKLPSTRPNPYPKPGSANDIAKGGLKAFDCRQTRNPAYFPPTGSGAPPCRLQGPYEINGRTAYYPRLQRAAP